MASSRHLTYSDFRLLAGRMSADPGINTVAADYEISWLEIAGRSLGDIVPLENGCIADGSVEPTRYWPVGPGRVRANLRNGHGYISVYDSHPLECAFNGTCGMVFVPREGEEPDQMTLTAQYPEPMKRNGLGYYDWAFRPFFGRWIENEFRHEVLSLATVLDAIDERHFTRDVFRIIDDSPERLRFEIADLTDPFGGGMITRTWDVSLAKDLDNSICEIITHENSYKPGAIHELEYCNTIAAPVLSRTCFSEHSQCAGIWLPQRICRFTPIDEGVLKQELRTRYLSVNTPDDMIDEIAIPSGSWVVDKRTACRKPLSAVILRMAA